MSGEKILLGGVEYGVEPMPPGADRTKSPIVGQLVTWADAGNPAVLTINFEGDRDKAHNRTKSYRKVCSRLGYTLHYKIDHERKKLLLWATPLPHHQTSR